MVMQNAQELRDGGILPRLDGSRGIHFILQTASLLAAFVHPSDLRE
jgi:hypothetical protein